VSALPLARLLLDHPLADDDALVHTATVTVTKGALRAAADAVAGELDAAGVQPGAAVVVRLPNGPDLVAAMFGVWLAGAVLVPVNVRAAPAELDRARNVTAPVAEIDADGAHPLGGDARTYPPGTAFVMWTSGTTGEPKAILHTHDAYIELLDRVLGPLRAGTGASAGASTGATRTGPPMPNLIPVSMALNAGLYNALFGLRAGAPLVLMDGFDTGELATLVRRFGIRSTVLPPAAIAMLNDDPTITDLAPLRYVRSITAPLSPVQARRFHERFGVFVLNGYGQAEIGEVIGWTAADAKEHRDKLGAAGRPHPGVDVCVVDEHGSPLPAGEVGVLRVRPPRMAAGYASGEDLGDRVDAGGFVDTGDLARIDDDGFVWIEGRVGDVVNRGGNKVSPTEVEEVLRLVPAVTDVAVVGAPDERLGEVPVALVVVRAPGAGAPSDEELAAHCRAHLTPYKVPVAFHRVAALDRNDAGKLDRRALARRVTRR
jgi:acyl-CoA synthetase (AMP-forming)/AMP-acid ligase II